MLVHVNDGTPNGRLYWIRLVRNHEQPEMRSMFVMNIKALSPFTKSQTRMLLLKNHFISCSSQSYQQQLLL
jgi:hypothetical protein